MSRRGAALVAVDGLHGGAVKDVARALAVAHRGDRAGVSNWGASGIFDELDFAGPDAARTSARTLLLLYATDLAFRLRWEIRPALAGGRLVIAASYVDTAVAFGRAAGIEAAWLKNLFLFAPRPAFRYRVTQPPARAARSRIGFTEFGWQHIAALSPALTRPRFLARAQEMLERSGTPLTAVGAAKGLRSSLQLRSRR